MANYILHNTAEDINSAIGKVLNPNTNVTNALTSSQSLVTVGAVKSYVDDEIASNQEEIDFATGYSDAGTSGTTTSAGFLIATAIRNSTYQGSNTIELTITVGTTTFQTKEQSLFGSERTILTIPIAKNESYSVSVGEYATLQSSKFKAFV